MIHDSIGCVSEAKPSVARLGAQKERPLEWQPLTKIEELSSIPESYSQGMAGGGAHRHLAFGSCFSLAVPWAILSWPFRPFS